MLIKKFALCLSKVLKFIIDPDQTCSVPGCRITSNLHILRDVLDYVDRTNETGILISLDEEKAFDRVNRTFLLNLLSCFGFGPSFCFWINTLYNGANMRIIVNEWFSDAIPLSRCILKSYRSLQCLFNMINVYDPLLASATPLVDAESFPPIVAPPVTAKVEVTPGTSGVPETTEPVNSMDVVDVLAKNSHVTSEVPPIVPEVEATPGPSGVSLLAAVESMDGVENVPVVENVTVVEDNNDINENITVENSSIENITKINVVKDKDNVGISDFSSQESRGMECSDSPDIWSFSSSTKASDLSSHFGVVCSSGSMHSSGCAILFRPSLSPSGSRYDTEGHYLQYELSFRDQSFHVCCLYVPNHNPAQDHFLNDLQAKIDLSVPSLLCGDFNTVFDRALDRRGSDPSDI